MQSTTPPGRLAPPAHGGDLSALPTPWNRQSRSLIDFSISINPLGPPPGVRDVLAAAAEHANRYPEPWSHTLRARLAALHAVPCDNLALGNGSNELIYLVARALPARRAVVLQPTYSEYRRASCAAGLAVFDCPPRGGDFVPEPVPVHTGDLVWMGHPNNPTACGWDARQLLDWIDGNSAAMFVVDEAFMPFWHEERSRSLVQAAANRSNLIVLRSLTKFFAVPGLRLGYLVASAESVSRLRTQQPTWSVNTLAQAAGLAAIADSSYACRTRDFVASARCELARDLAGIPGLRVFPSDVNFLLVRMEAPAWSSGEFCAALAARGFLVRDASNFSGLDDRYVRVAVRRPDENARLVAAWSEVFG